METKTSAAPAEKSAVSEAELFLADSSVLTRTALPEGPAPDVIFCGARAFRRVLRVRGGLQYVECSCWRIEEPVAAESESHGS
jgi:hypothetical protein